MSSIEAQLSRSGIVQCQRCQGFRHTTQNCPSSPACVRCSKRHHVSECPLQKAVNPEPPRCVNCGGRHRANHLACVVLQKEVQRALRPPPPEFVHTNMVQSAGAGLMAAAIDPANPPRPKRRRRGGRKHKPKKTVPKPEESLDLPVLLGNLSVQGPVIDRSPVMGRP